MKIRNGFVSNSSSSSFIVLGVKIKLDELRKKLLISEDDYVPVYDGLDIIYSYESGVAYVGKGVRWSDDGDCLPDNFYHISEAADIKERLMKHGIWNDPSQFGVHMGTC